MPTTVSNREENTTTLSNGRLPINMKQQIDINVPSLISLHDRVEATAYRAMFAAAPQDLSSQLGFEIREIAGAILLIAPGIPTPMFNRVIGLGNSSPATDAVLDEITTLYRKAGVAKWWVHVSPDVRPATLSGQLDERGFILPQRKSWAKVLRGTEPPPMVETTAKVHLAQPGERDQVAETICAAFEMPSAWAPWFANVMHKPDWVTVAALVDDKIIGGALLHVQGGNAWFGADGVLPEARRRHAHRALIAHRLEEAIRSGCKRIFTETGDPVGEEVNPSLRNMEACGFKKIFSRLNFESPAVAS